MVPTAPSAGVPRPISRYHQPMNINPFATVAEQVDLSPKVADEVKTTTCYMCACRCGIKVHLRDGAIRYIEGNRDHPVNKGVLCAKGSAGIMNHYSPARLEPPLLRVGERGAGEFKAITWEEAMALAGQWLGDIRKSDPRKLAFFTGRDQRQHEQPVGARTDADPFIGDGGIAGADRIDRDELCALAGRPALDLAETDLDRVAVMVLGNAEHHEIASAVPVGLAELPERAADAVEAGCRHVDGTEPAMGGVVRRAILLRPPAGQRLALVAAGEEGEPAGIAAAHVAKPLRRGGQRLVP